jgi:rhomboid family GlyGly-CTERM serine protease
MSDAGEPMQKITEALRTLFAREKFPWVFLGLTAAALLIQLNPAWRGALIYDRNQIRAGDFWRLWTGHFVHYGWPHFVADAGLFLILGRLMERSHPAALRTAAALMPLFISAVLYRFDAGMVRYAGLSAVNLGLLIFYALDGWRRNRFDWFWPGVLAIYVGEVVLEATRGGGSGGGMIPFDDPTVRVATSAHIAGGIYGVALWLWFLRRDRKRTDREVRSP